MTAAALAAALHTLRLEWFTVDAAIRRARSPRRIHALTLRRAAIEAQIQRLAAARDAAQESA